MGIKIFGSLRIVIFLLLILNIFKSEVLAVSYGCFPPETMVRMASGESKPISQVVFGDRVLSRYEDGRVSESKVLNLIEREKNNMCSVSFVSGETLKLTQGHPIFTDSGWKAVEPADLENADMRGFVSKLETYDRVVNDDGSLDKVESISCWSEYNKVYTLELEKGAHTFFAEGHMVHNWSSGYCGCDCQVFPDGTCAPSTSCCGGWGWTCFAAGTKVNMQDGNEINIEDVKVGDKVVSQSETGEKTVSTVTKLDQPIREHMCRLDFLDNISLKMTEEHPLMTTDGWKALDPNQTKNENPDLVVQKLEAGDKVMRDDGTFSELKSVSCWSGRTPAYNLILDGKAHTYFADGFLAHNKGGEPSCTNTSPDVPTLVAPDDGVGEVITPPETLSSVFLFDWNPITGWGKECDGTTRKYNLCFGLASSNPCSGTPRITIPVFDPNNLLVPPTSTDSALPGGNWYWAVQAVNKGGATSRSLSRSICIEGFVEPSDVSVGNKYLSAWTACSAVTHQRTRTCKEDCGTDNCAVVAARPGGLVQDCTGEIRGTLFDASNMTSCPSFDPVSGFLVGVPSYLKAANMAFGLSDTLVKGGTHPWSLLSPAVTDENGDYVVTVHVPASYKYDFKTFAQVYDADVKPKLICQASIAVMSNYLGNCATQPCKILRNMSFGFQRDYGGWWQVVGAGVHGELGIRSVIPAGLATEESLILGDGTATNRVGVLSSEVLDTGIVGINPDAKVSSKGWKVESKYKGIIYDWAYFNQQFKKYASTTWDGVSSLTYDDAGKGYQIFSVTGDVANFNFSPTGTQKVIFLVKGNVTISSNLTVPNGAFMAILASGDITFETSVGSVDGWYLGNNILVKCINDDGDGYCDKTDTQFLGNGSFVGWKAINLTRDRGELTNITGPSEKFTYRKDLYDNAPDPMKNVTKMYKPFVP